MDRRAYLAAAGSAVLFGGALADPAPVVEPVQERADDDEPTVASSLGDLRDSLGAATWGDVVYVPPDVEIDLTGTWRLSIPDGVTLASDGRMDDHDGARFHSSPGDEAPEQHTHKFELGRSARLTGVQLEGHHHEYVNPIEEHDGDFYAHRGNGVWAGRDAVVDNNEISGWLYAAVWAEDDAHVHDNFLHHNTWGGLGYGVVVPSGDNMPLIEDNRFNYNRHSIAAGGGPEVGYVARNNVVGPDWVGAQFDMHGDEGMVGVAGDEVVIEGNTFRGTHTVEAKTRNPGAEVPAIHIRGTPETGVWVENNHFYHEDRASAYQQTDGPHRVHFSDNTYGRPESE